MRLLLVEDNAEFATSIERAIRAIPDCELVWAASRESALAVLGAGRFDLVLLDRRIPTEDGALDDHQEHGWRIFQHVKEEFPGTPVWFLTGTEDSDWAAEMLNDHARTADLHGQAQPEQMYRVWWKKRVPECIGRVRAFAAERTALDRIAINVLGDMIPLDAGEATIIQMFGRRYQGIAVDVSALGGGLSGSRVVKAVAKNASHGPLMTAVAKVARLTGIEDEGKRYRDDVTRLAPGGFPPLSLTVDVGVGNQGGLFYGMVGDNLESLFERLAANHAGIDLVPAEIRSIEKRWYQARRAQDVQVGQIRRKFIGDAALHDFRTHLAGIDIGPIESTNVRVGYCCQHGDLHCANVLFADRGQAMLIDFGDVGESYSAVDPVTLELSTLFHKQRSMLGDGWPTVEHIDSWADVDRFTAGCAFAQFIRGCRQWAVAEAGSANEVVAIAYAFAVRQLKYEDTNKEWARALIRCCVRTLVK